MSILDLSNEDLNKDKEMFYFSNYSTKSKYYDDSKELVVGKMKDNTASDAVEKFAGLKPKMYSFLVDDNSEHEKAKGVKEQIIRTRKMFC